jgi:hypothetical protein
VSIYDTSGTGSGYIQRLASMAIEDALRAVLMFHEGGEWSADRRAEWKRITGSDEATTKVLCDHVRAALVLASEGDDHGPNSKVIAGGAAIPDSGGADPTM